MPKRRSSAAKLFRELHGFDAPKVRAIDVRAPRGDLVDVYRVDAIEGTKVLDEGFGRRPERFRHEFAPRAAPRLAADESGWGHLIGGRYKITGHGIEDDMARHRYYRMNPDLGGSLRGLAGVGAGLMLGAVAYSAVHAATPSRVSDTVKDVISVTIGVGAVYLPSSGMGKLVGAGAAAALIGATANRRWDLTGKAQSWVSEKMGSLWAKLLPPRATGSLGQLSAGQRDPVLPPAQFSYERN